MAAIRIPDLNSMSATVLAVSAIGYVLAGTAGQIRNVREAQRAWMDAGEATRQARDDIQSLREAITKTNASVDAAQKADRSTAVLKLCQVRSDVVVLIATLDAAARSLGTIRSRMLALKKFRSHLSQPAEFDRALDLFDGIEDEANAVRDVAEQIRQKRLVEEVDAMLDIAADAATDEALRLAAEITRAKPATSADDALNALLKMHDFAKANGIKLDT